MTRLEVGGELGRYRILKRLGAGAMGEVFLGEDPQIGRQVALKTVRVEEGKARDLEERKQRLLREARAAGRLLHPNIVALFDAGEDQGVFYLAFEFVEGKDLADRAAEGPELSLGEVLSIVRQASEALDAAHRQGVVHRDIKPSNIMITADHRVKIADFGIARVADQTSDLTMTGSVVGSPHYMSPEQIRGEPLDGRTDIFSLGVLFYEILCKRRPFEGETLTTLVYQILNQEPTPLVVRRPDLGPRLEQLVAKMMHKDRDQRFATAAEVAREIAECERELSAEKLAGAVRPDSGEIGQTTLMPGDSSTTVRPQPATAAPVPVTGVAPAPPAPPAPVAAAAAASAAPKSRSTLIVVALVAVVVLGFLVAAGFAARSFLRAQRAKKAAAVAAEQLQAEVTEEAEKLAASTPPGSGIARARPLQQPEPAETGPGSAAPIAPPNPGPTGTGTEPATEPESTPAHTEPRTEPMTRRDPVAPPTTRPTTSPPVRREPPVRTEPERQPEPEPQAPPPDPREMREAVIRNARVDREMSTGMNLSFEVEPKKAAERIIVRLDRIVVGLASEWDASKRHGRAYSVPESGLHILSFLVDGNEVYRIRIDARPGGGPNPTPIAVHLPQFGR